MVLIDELCLFILQLEEIELYKVNDVVPMSPAERVPVSMMTPMPAEQARIIKEFLIVPIQFEYVYV